MEAHLVSHRNTVFYGPPMFLSTLKTIVDFVVPEWKPTLFHIGIWIFLRTSTVSFNFENTKVVVLFQCQADQCRTK